MNKKFLVLLFVIIAVMGLITFYTMFVNPIEAIEIDARHSQQIPTEWIAAKDSNDNIAALLFYDEQQENYIYSIYHRGGLFSIGHLQTYGYKFQMGGVEAEIENGVWNFVDGQFNSILISMNRPSVAQIRLTSEDNTVEIIGVDADQPFVFTAPESVGQIQLLNSEGDNVPISVFVQN